MRRCALILAAVACLLAAPAALADGDPASDYLLASPVFIPPDDGVPPAYARQLNAVLLAAKQHGYVIRVALIKTPYDMGSVTILYRQPARYGQFLSQELYFVYKGRVLVVMPNGYGFARAGKPQPAQQAIVDRLPSPGSSGADLAAAATRGVVALAAASGVHVTAPALSGSTGTSANRDRLVIGGGAALVLVLAGGLALLRRRSRGRRPA